MTERRTTANQRLAAHYIERAAEWADVERDLPAIYVAVVRVLRVTLGIDIAGVDSLPSQL